MLRDLPGIALLTAAYVAAARVGLSLEPVNGVAAAVWPPSGLALGALMLFGYRFWPGVACGAVLANVSVGVPWWAALGIGAGNALEAVCAAYLLRRSGFHNSLDRARDVLALVGLAALCSTLVSATIGSASAWLGGVLPSSNVVTAWLTWWMGDAMGDLVLAPALLTWGAYARAKRRPLRYAEIAVLLVLLSITCRLTFGRSERVPIIWGVFPFVIWAALRLEQPGTTATVLVASGMVVLNTAQGLGPFAHGALFAGAALHDNLAWLQLFMGAVSVTGLALGAALSERQDAEDARRGSETRFQTLIEKSHDGIALIDAQGIVVYASPSTARIHGAPLPVGVPVGEIVHPDDRENLLARLAELIQKPGHVVQVEYRLRHVDGSWRWAEGTGASMLGEPSVRGIVANYRDVTERKEAEEALRQVHAELERRVLERTAELRAANEALSRLSSRVLALQDEERRRIGRELHENSAQTLAGAAMNLAVVQQAAKHLNAPARAALAESAALVDRSVREIRTLSYLLHPPLLDETGLRSTVRWYADGFAQRSGIAVDVEVDPELGRLPADMERTLFRVVQGCLTNVHRHAQSAGVRIQLVRTATAVTLTVEDRGQGIGAEMPQVPADGDVRIGVSLPGMRERLRQLGGHLEINSTESRTIVLARIPLAAPTRPPQDSQA